MNSESGYIYVLTNESFHRENWIKIGYADNVSKRVKELSGTSVPLPFEVYCTYEIPRIKGIRDPDKLVHDLIQSLNPNLRISANREFFELYPWEAYNMLEAIAKMHGRLDKIWRNDDSKVVEDITIAGDYSIDALFPENTLVRSLFDLLSKEITDINPELTINPTKLYVSFKRGKGNVVSVWPKDGWVEVVLCAKLGTIKDPSELIYDISNRKWSAAQYALKYFPDTDMDAVRQILKQVVLN